MGFDGFADAQAVAELVEFITIARFGAMQVFAFGDELHVVLAGNAMVLENPDKRPHVGGVDDEQFMFVELDFHRAVGGKGGQAGATVVKDKVLEIATVAFEDRQIDLFTEQIAMFGTIGFVAGFQDDIDDFTQGIEEVEENVEKVFAGNRRRKDRNFVTGLGIAVGLHAVTLTRHDLAVQRGPNGIG